MGVYVRGGIVNKNCRLPERSDVKKPDIYGMTPVVLPVNMSNDVLSPAAVSYSLLMTCFNFPFTLQVFLCAHPNMHDAQNGDRQDAILASKITIDAITCISLIGTQCFFYREFLTISSALALEFRESLP